MILQQHQEIITHGHLFCGIGVGAMGFNNAQPRVEQVAGRFVCVGGIDVDAGAIANFSLLTGVPGTVLDLFSYEQYVRFHGTLPPAGWREATPADIRRVLGETPPDVVFLSAPCKGFSGLLSATKSKTDKYQALNELTVRGVWLLMEAYKDDPVPVILFENVPRILNRGRFLLDQILAVFASYGRSTNIDTHDCGVIGGLAQSRKRALLISRDMKKIPPFIYSPRHHALRGVGEVIGKLPLPGDPVAGIMHRVPALQWKTWMRLALVPAGKDWRALNDYAVVDGNLRDFGIVPEVPLRDNALGVNAWTDTAPVISTQRAPGQGRFSVADPRPMEGWQKDVMGVRDWDESTGVIAGRSTPTNGRYSVADPRPTQANQTYAQYGVNDWSEPSGTVSGQSKPGGGAHSVADPRLGRKAHSNVYRIVPFDAASISVTSSRDVGIADPRPASSEYASRKYKVTAMGQPSRAVIGASTTGDGAFAVADPRMAWNKDSHRNKMKVVDDKGPAGTITGSNRVGSGALSVADSRREHYQTGGHYGVVDWSQTGYAVSGSACHDNGFNSVADPRSDDASNEGEEIKLPAPDDRLVCRIVAQDGTWHRPFTTLDLAALQSLFDPEDAYGQDGDGRWYARKGFELISSSDTTRREWIGNAVPGAAATGMAETIGEAILLARMGVTFTLDSRNIWAKPGALALAVHNNQIAYQMEGGLI